jgi:hypothetical protein
MVATKAKREQNFCVEPGGRNIRRFEIMSCLIENVVNDHSCFQAAIFIGSAARRMPGSIDL